MYKVFSMRTDVKAKLLNDAGQKYGLSVSGSDYKRNSLFFVFLIKNILKNNFPHAVLFRYFNDHKNMIHSFFLAFNVIFSALLCVLFKIKIFWILHNVDKETSEHYPSIIRFLRKFVGDRATSIYVTDPLLVPVAKKLYPNWSLKIDYITFGSNPQKANLVTNSELLKVLHELNVNKLKNEFVIFCPSAPGDKYTHLQYADKLITSMKKIGVNYKVIIVGNLAEYLRINKDLKIKLVNNSDIVLFENYTSYNLDDIAPFIDFYWRALSDQSVSFTLYEAASIKKPVITLAEGFMMEAIIEYKMGSVCDFEMSNVSYVHESLLRWDEQSAINFLNNHSWEIGVKKIMNNLS